MSIRSYSPEDYSSVMRICLETADDGADGTPFFKDPDLVGLVYAAPYVTYEPDLCFIVEDDAGRPAGYVLGTSDSNPFYQWLNERWNPPLREKYARPADDDETPDGEMLLKIHRERKPIDVFMEYSAHLHIDLLPSVQRRGYGRELIEAFCSACAAKGVHGVRLGVALTNESAIAFYRKTGFTVLKEYDGWLLMGRVVRNCT